MREAIDYTDRAIEAAKRRGDTTINIIVGSPFYFPKHRKVLLTTADLAPRQRLAFEWWGCKVEARHRGVNAKVRTPRFQIPRVACAHTCYFTLDIILSRNLTQITPVY